MIKLNPLTLKKIRRFRSIKRGYYSFLLFVFLVFLALISELWINSRALMVKYEGNYYFPTYGDMIPGKLFGLDYAYETNYRELSQRFKEDGSGNYVIMPLVPYNPFESVVAEGRYPPTPPSITEKHFLGTDDSGRDVLARLVYGFRTSIAFSLMLLVFNYTVGVAIGCAMGYFGGKFDLVFQRIIEIWSNVPFLYSVIIISSIMIPNFFSLAIIMMFFGWMMMTWYMRTSSYKEKAREYVLAARALGASHWRIIFNHIIPNSISIIVTFIPFSISAAIVSLTALDFLGFGLPPPTPSWGELLHQGQNHLSASWLVFSVVAAMVLVLTTVTFTGEAVREAFDPKKHTTYE